MSRYSEHDPLVENYQHLPHLPRAAEALQSLRKIASLVKPIMRNKGWRVGTLTEFYPEQHNLLGLNKDHGREICLRLRYAGDQTQFLPLENVVDTMLHELSHNLIGPHNEQFHALWNDLRDEYERLLMKGYTGEGFLSQGQRLGGKRVPMDEMRRQARVAAERRKSLGHGSGHGQKLGGRPVPRGGDIRQIIADAASRRTSIIQGCGAGSKDADFAADQASRNGFRTKAEEDDANEQAISQALWELVQEDEARRAGLDVGEVRNSGTWATEGLMWDPQNGLRSATPPPMPQASKPLPPLPRSQTANVQGYQKPTTSPIRRKPVTLDNSTTKRSWSGGDTPPKRSAPIDLTKDDERHSKPLKEATKPKHTSSLSAVPTKWTCDVCTLVNPIDQLCCGACEVERPNMTGTKIGQVLKGHSSLDQRIPPKPAEKTMGWNCNECGAFMEHKWWTCSACGLMKPSS